MYKMASAGLMTVLLAGSALADTAPVTTKVSAATTDAANAMFLAKMPGDTASISTYYNRVVYNNAGDSIGDVNDLLMGADGKIAAAVIGVGGFLGMGEKEVAVPFEMLRVVRKDNSWHLAMDTTKEALTAAPTFESSTDRVRLLAPKPATQPAQ